MAGSKGSEFFAYGLLISAIALTLLLPLAINLLYPADNVDLDYQRKIDEINADYKDFTGSAPVKEDVWLLRGVFTPYLGTGARGYTSDGWLYGTEIKTYSPSQYTGTQYAYTVTNRETWTDGDGNTRVNDLSAYQYSAVGAGIAGVEVNDIYTAVSLDVNQKSNIFFSPTAKHTVGDKFYYDYSGYRYAFSPLGTYNGVDQNGNRIEFNNATATCSIIWYSYYDLQDGLAGQLVYRGADGGTAYITSETIINNFNSANNTAKHTLSFNGVDLYLYIRLDPVYSSSMSIQDCFNAGYWSIMITSASADTTAYTATDYKFNPENVFTTMIDLLTFNLDDYGFSPFVGLICSFIIVVPFYVGLLVIGFNNMPVLILEGILLAIQAITTAGSWLGGLF